MPVTAGALLTSVCINGSVGLGCLGLFGVLRRWKVTAKLYEPKRYTGGERDAGRRPPRLATPLPRGVLSWIQPVWCYAEDEVIDLCGLDVAAFFRLLQLGVKLFAFISVWSLLLVMPVNFSGGYLERHKRHDPAATGGGNAAAGLAATGGLRLGNFTDAIHTNLDLLTLSNVPPGSSKMWVHLASTYVITLLALKWLWDLSRDVAFKRAEFLALEGSRGPGSSVLVTDIPGLEAGTPLDKLKMSWVKWVLPEAWFRRGFDKQQEQQAAPGHARQRASSPGQQEVQDVWTEAVTVLRSNGGNVQALVEREMRQVYGADSVAAVVCVHDTRSMDAAAATYQQLQTELEDVLDWYQCHLPPSQPPAELQDVESAQQQGADDKPQEQEQGLLQPLLSRQLSWQPKPHQLSRLRRKTALVVGPRWGAWGIEKFGVTPTKVDALRFYTQALQQQLGELQVLQQAVLHQLPRPAAIVTFRGQLMATLASASLHCYDETAWAITPAPHPAEVEWTFLGIRSWEQALRQLVLWAAFWLLVLFYAPLVAAIQAPVNMDNLRKIPVLAQLLALPLVTDLLQGFLPSLVLLIFLAVVPFIIHGLIKSSGLTSTTAVDAQLIKMYHLLQLFAVFIFSFISGTALSQLQGLIDDPHRIVALLGVSAPQQASFFSTWILLLGLSRTPLQLLRLPQLAWYLLRLQLADSPRARQRLWAEQQRLLGYVVPLHTLVLLLGLVFCCASPLIAPVTLIYFVSVSIAQRYQWLYIFRHPYEGAGTLWRQVFTQVLVGVYFFVAVMGCLLGIKRFAYALLLLPLAAAVLVFHVLADRALQRPLTLPSAREAAAVDHSLQQRVGQPEAGHPAGSEEPSGSEVAGGGGGGDAQQQQPAAATQRSSEADELRELYLPPCLKLNQQQLQPLLDEAADVERRLAALGL